MKKFTLLTLASLCLLSLTSSAQIAKGATSLGGSFNIGSQKDKTTLNSNEQNWKASGWSLSPEIGKAVGENKIVGLFLNFSGSNSEGNGSGNTYNKTTTASMGGGLFYRLYLPLNSRFYLFGGTALGVNVYGEERKTDTKLYAKNKGTGIVLSAVPGISFKATKRLYLETSLTNLLALSYSKYKWDYYDLNTGAVTQTNKSKQLNASANTNGFSNLSVGVRWILPAKK